ncbi:hypothetical protein Ancab_006713 [Ancistrocladus abbreviatus]
MNAGMLPFPLPFSGFPTLKERVDLGGSPLWWLRRSAGAVCSALGGYQRRPHLVGQTHPNGKCGLNFILMGHGVIGNHLGWWKARFSVNRQNPTVFGLALWERGVSQGGGGANLYRCARNAVCHKILPVCLMKTSSGPAKSFRRGAGAAPYKTYVDGIVGKWASARSN